MTYQVLARKWRPQDFAGLVGQEHVVTALGNALAEERIAQAYLFSGIRGVGKTTAARVLAKALNCERGPADGPCNECTSCVEITSGHSLDVIEVDAATYSKVEQVRELTETLRYGPARGRYKVVVLDEVHRLSRQAFDALLKIVEEPPAHLVFIFATTEIDAVPATILSRCQEFQFRRVTQPVLAAHLRQISEAEKIEVSDAALRMIARAGEGSVRDSVALLDQMATFGSGTISDEDAQRILGGLDTAIFQKLLAALLQSDRAQIVGMVREIEANGWDPHNVYSQFLLFLRDALHLALGGEQEGDLPAEEAEMVRRTVADHGYESLLQILQLLISSELTVRRSEFSLLALEIAWLRAAELPKVKRLESLLSGDDSGSGGAGPKSSGSGGSSRTSAGERAASARAAAPRSIAGKVLDDPSPHSHARDGHAPDGHAPDSRAPAEQATDERSVREAARPEPETSPRPPADSPAETDASPADVDESRLETCDPARLPAFLELLANRRQSLAAHFEHAELRFDRRTMLIVPKGDSFLTKALGRKSNQETLEQALLETWGEPVSWRLQGSAAKSARRAKPTKPAKPRRRQPAPGREHPNESLTQPPRERARQPEWTAPDWTAPEWTASGTNGNGSRISSEETAALSELPVVRTILSTFGGKIQSVEPASEESPP